MALHSRLTVGRLLGLFNLTFTRQFSATHLDRAAVGIKAH